MFQGQSRGNGRGRGRGRGRGHFRRDSSNQSQDRSNSSSQKTKRKASTTNKQNESKTKQDQQPNHCHTSTKTKNSPPRKQHESRGKKKPSQPMVTQDEHLLSFTGKAKRESGQVTCSFECENVNWSNKELIKFCEKHFVMFIMRGIPGSGKSTLAQKLKSFYGEKDAVICSADDYRYNTRGEYVFSVDQLYKTHLFCQQKAETSCKKQTHVVIIDNTNIHSKDYNPYLTLANKYNYFVVFLKMKAHGIEHHVMYNTHKVPRDSIAKMLQSYGPNPLPYYFNWAVPNSEGKRLRNVIQRLIQSCMNADSSFNHFLSNELKTTPQSLFKTFHLQNASSHHYHATAAYANQSNIPRKISDKYTKSATVKNALGSVSFLQVAGIYITPLCIAARLLLTEEQKKLWGRNDSLNHGEINPIAFESNKIMESSLEKMLNDLNLKSKYREEKQIEFKVPNGCTQPSHSSGCTAHITLGTRGNNKPVVAKDTLYQIVYLEANTLPLSETVTSGNIAVRCYSGDKWVIYFRHPFLVQSLFCGHYNLTKTQDCPSK